MKILIAEDESDISATYQAALESRNHEVTIVGDGVSCIKLYQEGLEQKKLLKSNCLNGNLPVAAKKTGHMVNKEKQKVNKTAGSNLTSRSDAKSRATPYDVLVLDYKMPGKNGMEVAKEILEMNPEQRIIFASAYVKDTLEESVKELNRVIELLQKPFSIDALIDTIEDKEVYEELKKIMENIRMMDKSDTSSAHVELSREQMRDIFEGLRKIQKHRTF
jgi:CheY-like chemotaxis protein